MDTKQIYGYHANNGTDTKIWVSDRTVFIYIMEFGYGSMLTGVIIPFLVWVLF